MKIAGLASNRGRNLRHIADAAPGDAELSVVLTNREQAPVLEAATERRIPTEVVEREDGGVARGPRATDPRPTRRLRLRSRLSV